MAGLSFIPDARAVEALHHEQVVELVPLDEERVEGEGGCVLVLVGVL